jgi:ubiquinone/menaquinone biosynthesis C-methylase UbiE
MQKVIHTLLYLILRKTINSNLSIIFGFLTDCRNIIDVGCGNGLTALLISEKLDKKVSCLDTGDFRWGQAKKLEHNIYNGEKIPYSDNSYDCAMVFFVLHHTQNPKNLLKECVRISRNKILILEETYNSKFQNTLMVIYDLFLNYLIFGEKISTPNFYTEKKWSSIFRDLHIRNVEKINFSKKWWRIPNRVLYVLNK